MSTSTDLKCDASPEEITQRAASLSTSCNSQANKVNLSSIASRHNKLNEKAMCVNKYLKEESEVCFIDYRNISPKHNYNRSCYN